MEGGGMRDVQAGATVQASTRGGAKDRHRIFRIPGLTAKVLMVCNISN